MNVAVVSHERSGTHFLMRSICECFGYKDDPPWNLDYEQGVNLWSPHAMSEHLEGGRFAVPGRILKTHHVVDFMSEFMSDFVKWFKVIYIARNPMDVMASMCKFTHALAWCSAPKTNSPSYFARAEPVGSSLRYQRQQEQTMLHRWKRHVDGWLYASEIFPVHVVRYEDLCEDWRGEMRRLSLFIGEPITPGVKQPGPVGINPWTGGSHPEFWNHADFDFFSEVAGDTIARLYGKEYLRKVA